MPAPKRPTELTELSFLGPFGGIQSEAARVQLESEGFADAVDVIFYDRSILPRPGLSFKPQPTTQPIQGIFDFFDSGGIRHSGVIANQSLYSWNPSTGTWTTITGPLSPGSNLFSWTVVGGKLLFSQGIDPVQVWDGNALTYSVVSANAVPAFHLGELGNHLISCPVKIGTAYAPQRLMWTGAGDPTDWTSFDSGQVDLFNDLGPINGWRKVYQQGYVFQQWGIVQQALTGNANQPFIFVPLSSRQKGLYYPFSLSGSGEFAIYVGKDNVYLFNGSASTPIGDAPIQGRSWLGARDRILADLYSSPQGNMAYGFYVPSTRNQEYETYWLIIPGGSTWVYSMKEGNWTRFTFNPAVGNLIANFFDVSNGLRIIDLLGTIQSQTWSPAGLVGIAAPQDSIAIGFNDGTVGTFDFTVLSDRPWTITTGSLAFGDTRHSKDLRRIRVVLETYTQVDLTIQATNEQSQQQTQTFSIPAVLGTTTYEVFPFHLPGVFITLTLSGPAGQNFRMSEISLGFGIGREVTTQ